MADHSKPLNTSTYANYTTELDARFDDITIGLDPALTTPTNLPTNAIRWNSALFKHQKWNGTTWGDLSARYDININGTVGATTPNTGAFTTLSSTGNTTLGDAPADTLTVNATPTFNVAIPAGSGGTGQSLYTVGDILYASATGTLSKLAGVATGNSLISGGVGTAPSWGKIGLTTHVSGQLPIANGGTNSTATPTNGGVGYGTGTAYAFSLAGTAGQALLSAGAAAPVWTTLTLENLPDAWTKRSVGCATTAALTINTAQTTIDGVTLSASTRVLVKDQAAPAQNGIYTNVTTTSWTRTADADTASEIAGGLVNVDSGTVNGGTVWSTSFKATDTLGTTAMNWYTLFDSGTTVLASNGGTGQSVYAIGDLLYASTTTALSKLADVATGNALISGGVGVAPSWGKIGLTTHVSGQLGIGNGGTNITTYTTGDILYASATNVLGKLADVATGNVLISGGVGVAPAWGKVGLTTHVSGTLGIGNGGTGAATLAAAGIPELSADQTFTGANRGAVTAANTGSFDMALGNNFSCTPTATAALTFTNITAGQSGYILLVNGANYVMTAAATTKVNSSFLSLVSTTGTYLISYFSNGTNVYVTTAGAMA